MPDSPHGRAYHGRCKPRVPSGRFLAGTGGYSGCNTLRSDLSEETIAEVSARAQSTVEPAHLARAGSVAPNVRRVRSAHVTHEAAATATGGQATCGRVYSSSVGGHLYVYTRSMDVSTRMAVPPGWAAFYSLKEATGQFTQRRRCPARGLSSHRRMLRRTVPPLPYRQCCPVAYA